jgi:putative ABC transport system ATP-binding protein
VIQYFNLIPTLTAAENITLPAALAGAKVDREWLGYLVGQLGIADRLTHRPGDCPAASSSGWRAPGR